MAQSAVNLFADEPVPFAVTEAGRKALSAVPSQPSAPTVPSGFRLVQALVGRSSANASHVWIPCPDWCDLDHSTDRVVAVEDVWHTSPYIDLMLPHRDGAELLAYFRLGLDPYSSDPSKRRPFIFGEDGTTANGYYADPEHIEKFCDEGIAALEKLRAMARQCRALGTAEVAV